MASAMVNWRARERGGGEPHISDFSLDSSPLVHSGAAHLSAASFSSGEASKLATLSTFLWVIRTVRQEREWLATPTENRYS